MKIGGANISGYLKGFKAGEYTWTMYTDEILTTGMNTFLGVMWGLIDPDMFASVADTLEDVMQASVPGVIENVRVAEINQGNNPFRILSLRALPDGHVQELKDDIHRQNEKNKDPQELAADEEGGDYYNLECSFAYHAKPSSGNTSEKAKNMHSTLSSFNLLNLRSET